jgi:hypothetical protein
LHPALPRRAKTRPLPCEAAVRRTLRRIMSSKLVRAGELVSWQCLKVRHTLQCTLSL